MVAFIILLLFIGLIAGAVARFVLPGRDPIGCLGTMALGVVGSFVGGFLEHLVQYHNLNVHGFQPSGLIGSIIGAILVLLLRFSGMEPGRRRRL
jgi:uncharacterized membrane protein YeaQ/YmgE (transglycosylase-associated protein family)